MDGDRMRWWRLRKQRCVHCDGWRVSQGATGVLVCFRCDKGCSLATARVDRMFGELRGVNDLMCDCGFPQPHLASEHE